MTEGMARGGAWDLGRPGGSARAEFERRRASELARRRRLFGRVLGPVVDAVTPPNPNTIAWARGGQGEEVVGRYLTDRVGRGGVVLHDRAIPGSRANIDHVAIVASGVWVIDTKRYRGRVEQRGGWLGRPSSLFVHRQNRNNLVASALRQRQLVQRATGPRVNVQAALCFTDADWGFLGRPFRIDDVLVSWPRRLGDTLAQPGPLDPAEIAAVAAALSDTFPAYAPSGISHKPTGASPNR